MLKLDEVGRNIVLLRNAQLLTQEQVAFQSRISVSRLQDIEYGCKNSSVNTLTCISRTLKVHPLTLPIFSQPDKEILASIHQIPRFPEQPRRPLQVCHNIVLLRKAEKLTQQQLANMSNISVSYLRDIEQGCANMTVAKLARIAEVFQLSLLELSMLTTSDDALLDMVRHARLMAEMEVHIN